MSIRKKTVASALRDAGIDYTHSTFLKNLINHEEKFLYKPYRESYRFSNTYKDPWFRMDIEFEIPCSPKNLIVNGVASIDREYAIDIILYGILVSWNEIKKKKGKNVFNAIFGGCSEEELLLIDKLYKKAVIESLMELFEWYHKRKSKFKAIFKYIVNNYDGIPYSIEYVYKKLEKDGFPHYYLSRAVDDALSEGYIKFHCIKKQAYVY